MDEYYLLQCTHNGWVNIEVTKDIYGLKQAGKLANDLLTELSMMIGYCQCRTTPSLWWHKWCPVTFVLIVNDLAIKYVE